MNRLLACLLYVTPLTLLAAEPAAPRSFEQVDLFEAGQEGYALYRIPGIVRTAKGTLLAYCEARKSASSDWGHIDIVMRRSTDGGRTWEPMRKVVALEGPFERNPAAVAQKLGKEGEITLNNPVAIAESSGRVHLLSCVEYWRCFHQMSDDDGVTWSKPVEITTAFNAFRPEYDWKVLAVGPGHGVQLQSGRLVVAVWLSLGTGGHAHRPSVTSTIYSDDHGQTWQRGDIAVPNTTELINPNETTVAELSDGRVMLNVRSESHAHRRLVTISPNGATHWTTPEFVDALKEPICFGSLISTVDPRTKRSILVFANPDNLERKKGAAPKPGQGRDRINLTLSTSTDDGKTWPHRFVVEPGFSGYSDLASDNAGTVFCFYERGTTDGSSYRTKWLSLARIPVAELVK